MHRSEGFGGFIECLVPKSIPFVFCQVIHAGSVVLTEEGLGSIFDIKYVKEVI